MEYFLKRTDEVHGEYGDSISGLMLVGLPIALFLILVITNFLLMITATAVMFIILAVHLREWDIAMIGLSLGVVIIHPPMILLLLVVHAIVKIVSEANK